MRIVSKFKDYYDTGMGLDQDRATNYIREPKIIIFRKAEILESAISVNSPMSRCWSREHNPEIFKDFHKLRTPLGRCIGFAGKIYHFFHMTQSENPDLPTHHFGYTIEDIDRFVETFFDKNEKEMYYGDKNYLWQRRSRTFKSFSTRKNYISIFEEIKNYKNDKLVDLLFEKIQAPIFSFNNYYDRSYVIANPCLNFYDFYRVVDPYTAYQEVRMFVENTAVPIKPIPDIPDETMAEIKGFNKFSFRKDKSK